MVINTRWMIDQNIDQYKQDDVDQNGDQQLQRQKEMGGLCLSRIEEGGLDVSTGLNDQISQLIGHTYYLMAPSALSLAETSPSGSLGFPGT